MNIKQDLVGIYEAYHEITNSMHKDEEGLEDSSPSIIDLSPLLGNGSEKKDTGCHSEKNIDMAKSEVFRLIKTANDLLNLLERSNKMEPWMLSKIVLACDYICSVKSVVEYDDFENYCCEIQDGIGEIGSDIMVVSKIKDMLQGEDIHVNEEVLKTVIINIEKLKN